MAAVILAAGRGQRMMPLTANCPKPLLKVHGKTLIDWQIQALCCAGVQQFFINTAYLGDKITEHFAKIPLPAPIHFSHEGHDFGQALETAGGISRLLPHLPEIFWITAADIFAPDFAFATSAHTTFAHSGDLAHLWLVPNPAHNPHGDFILSAQGRALNPTEPAAAPTADAISSTNTQTSTGASVHATPREGVVKTYTYGAIALVRRELFLPPWHLIPVGNPTGIVAPLAPLLRRAAAAQRVGASLLRSAWTDVGTPERLAALNATPLTLPPT